MNLPTYRRFKKAEFETASDDELLDGAVDWILREGATWVQEASEHDLSGLSAPQRAVYHSWIIDMEVSNGGFNQYLFNTRGKYIDDGLAAYELLEAPDYLALFREVIDKAGLVVDSHIHAASQESVTAMLEAFSESYEGNPLNELGSRYYDLSPDIDSFQVALVRRYPDDFALPEPA